MSSCLKHANQTLNAMAVIASSLSLFLGIAYLLRNMYLCSLIQDYTSVRDKGKGLEIW